MAFNLSTVGFAGETALLPESEAVYDLSEGPITDDSVSLTDDDTTLFEETADGVGEFLEENVGDEDNLESVNEDGSVPDISVEEEDADQTNHEWTEVHAGFEMVQEAETESEESSLVSEEESSSEIIEGEDSDLLPVPKSDSMESCKCV